MKKLSLCSIMKNEEQNIADFIDHHIDHVEEMILVDNGSTDKSVETAKQKGAIVYTSEEKFDLARNIYIEKASNEWILVLDIDERMLPKDINKLKEELENMSQDILGVVIPSFQYFGETKWTTFYMPRVIKNVKKLSYESPIHASVTDSIEDVNGSLGYIYAPYHHFDGIISEERNLDKRNRNLSMLRERLKQKPDDIKIINAIASELRALHRYDEALEIAKKAMDLDKDGTKRSFQGYAYTCCCAKKYNEAIEYSKIQIDFYQSAINNKSSRAARFVKQIDSCNVIIAKSYLELNDIGKCEEILKKNIENNPELPHNYLNLYLLDPINREDMLERARDLNPGILWEQVSNKINCYTLYEGASSVIK